MELSAVAGLLLGRKGMVHERMEGFCIALHSSSTEKQGRVVMACEDSDSKLLERVVS